MSDQIRTEVFTKQLNALLTEVFEKVQGIVLDSGTSLEETLADVTAAQASIQTVPGSSSIAAHVYHLLYYVKVLLEYMDGKSWDNVDWPGSWKQKEVSDSEWNELRKKLAADYKSLRSAIDKIEDWNDEKRLGGAVAIVVHTASHLGAIRQMLKTIRN